MRGFRYLAAATAITGLLAGSVATAASAATSPRAGAQAAAGVHLRGGATAVTTAPGVAPVLLKNGIVPLATWPGSQSVRFLKSGPAVRFRFPVTGGRVALSPLEGTIGHHDGILFINVKTPAPLFRLDLSHARLAAGKHIVTARGIGLKLTSAAAKALNAELGTKLFSAGLKLGTAKTLLRF